MNRHTYAAAAVVVGVAISIGVGALRATGAGANARSARTDVSVLYAGSLVNYMEHRLGPGFERATGFGFSGIGGGSTELANEIKGGVRQADVFVSASAKTDASLEGRGNGNWVSWYSTFMASPLELAYNPSSRFSAELRRGRPWYKVLTQPGIRVGRTDPVLDPKGVLTVEAVRNAARRLHDPALVKALGSFAVFPETALVGRLQAGQLDAGFFYTVEARNAGLRTVSLFPVYKYALYTVTILNGARHRAAAEAFVRYLLAGRSHSLGRDGLVAVTPTFSGSPATAPAGLRRLLGAR
jgi:molybdate/tungstate transport system substrate-binding protein